MERDSLNRKRLGAELNLIHRIEAEIGAVGRDVILQTHGQDKYGRTLADVFLRDGTNVNHELVKDGWCWWYRK